MYTYGIDVSAWQARNGKSLMDWKKAWDEGIRFAIIKATQDNWNDVAFLSHLAGAKEAGMIVGAYHYMTWDVSAIIQARTFLNAIKDQPIDFMVLDFEKNNLSERPIPRPQPGASITSAYMMGWLSYVFSATGKFPLIYTRKSFWVEYGTKADWVSMYDLWDAWYPEPIYNVFMPTAGEAVRFERLFVPAPFKGWKFWQFTAKGEGLRYGLKERGDLDLDLFNGSLSELKKYLGLGGDQMIEIPDNALQLLWDAHPGLHQE